LPADPTLPGPATACKGPHSISGKPGKSSGCGGKDEEKLRPRITADSVQWNYALTAGAERRIRQAIQRKYGINAPALDTTPPWEEDRQRAK